MSETTKTSAVESAATGGIFYVDRQEYPRLGRLGRLLRPFDPVQQVEAARRRWQREWVEERLAAVGWVSVADIEG